MSSPCPSYLLESEATSTSFAAKKGWAFPKLPAPFLTIFFPFFAPCFHYKHQDKNKQTQKNQNTNIKQHKNTLLGNLSCLPLFIKPMLDFLIITSNSRILGPPPTDIVATLSLCAPSFFPALNHTFSFPPEPSLATSSESRLLKIWLRWFRRTC